MALFPRWLTSSGRRAMRRAAYTRGYEAAAVGYRTEGWITPHTSGNAELSKAGRWLVDRSRDLVRNHPQIVRAHSNFISDSVGSGLVPKVKTGDAGLNKVVRDAFDKWARSRHCHDARKLTFFGIQAQLSGALWESGSVIVRRRIRRLEDVIPGEFEVPLQLQPIESDLLDVGKNEVLENGNTVIRGEEVTALGDPVAYWLFKGHPGETLLLGGLHQSVRIPAESIAFVYDLARSRPGQVGAAPFTTPVIRAARDYDTGRDAERVRRQIEACLTGIVTDPDTSDYPNEDDDDGNTPGIVPRLVDGQGKPVETFRPGLVAYLRGGRTIKIHSPATVGGFAEYAGIELHAVAAGLLDTYEAISTDAKGTTFSSGRLQRLNRRSMIGTYQAHTLIPMFCDRAWEWWTAVAVAAGAIPPFEGGHRYPVEWVPAYVEEIDRRKDALADRAELENGSLSLPDLLERRNPTRAWEEQLVEIGKGVEACKAAGIELVGPYKTKAAPVAVSGSEVEAAEASQEAETDEGEKETKGESEE